MKSLPDSLGTFTVRTQLSCHEEAKGPWQRGARTCGPNPSLTPSCQPAPTSRPGESAIFKRILQNLDSIRGQKPDPEGHVLDSSTYMKCPVMSIYRNSDEKLSYIEIYRSHSSLYMLTWSLFFFLNFSCSRVDLQCCVSFGYTAKNLSYMYPLFLRFFSHIGHYRILSRVPCAIQ